MYLSVLLGGWFGVLVVEGGVAGGGMGRDGWGLCDVPCCLVFINDVVHRLFDFYMIY